MIFRSNNFESCPFRKSLDSTRLHSNFFNCSFTDGKHWMNWNIHLLLENVTLIRSYSYGCKAQKIWYVHKNIFVTSVTCFTWFSHFFRIASGKLRNSHVSSSSFDIPCLFSAPNVRQSAERGVGFVYNGQEAEFDEQKLSTRTEREKKNKDRLERGQRRQRERSNHKCFWKLWTFGFELFVGNSYEAILMNCAVNPWIVIIIAYRRAVTAWKYGHYLELTQKQFSRTIR